MLFDCCIYHWQFCIIDKKVLLNGSFNWSRQAVVGNAENLVIHKDGPIIRTLTSSLSIFDSQELKHFLGKTVF